MFGIAYIITIITAKLFDKYKNLILFNDDFQAMHKYLTKTCSFLLLTSAFLWGMLSVAYVSVENYQPLPAVDHVEESLTPQEEGINHAPFSSLVSPFSRIFNEPDKRNSQDNPTHDFLYTAQYRIDKAVLALSPIKLAKASFFSRKRNIYLLDCTFLI